MSSEQWFDDYAEAVFSYILVFVRNPDIAEELTQETFLKVVENEHQFKGHSSVKTWIFRIAYTTTMSYFRRKKPIAYYLDAKLIQTQIDSYPDEVALLTMQQKQFYEALNGLKPSYQQIIILRKINGFSTRETSLILGCSEGKVKMGLFRALAAFKKELEKGGITNETLIRR